MVNDWIETTLGDISTDVSYGYTESADTEKVGPRFLRITDIQNGVVDWKTVPYCPIDDSKLKKYLLEEGDIVVARTGNSTGENYIFTGEEDTVFASYLIRFKIDRSIANPFYVWYSMRSPNWWAFVNSSKTGSAQAGANAKVLGLYPLDLPSLDDQKAIAHILGSLDDKIELNRQMNETLEAMAQALFKSWFVDFDPVIDNALAAGNAIPDELLERAEQRKGIEKKDNSEFQSLFPDKFELMEGIGWIPEGWQVRKLKSICQVINGRAYKNTEFKEQGTPIVRIQNLSRSGKTVYSDLDLPEDKIICTEDFLYAWSATFGPHIWRGPKSIYHYHIWKMDVDESIVSRYFLYLAMFRKTESMKNAGTGSIFTHLTKKIMEGQDILIGDEKVNTAFSNQVTVIFKKITKLDEENNSLSKIRDTLLPKLMSGKLRIPDATELVREAI
jgi:type I restriction enzyme S subunit